MSLIQFATAVFALGIFARVYAEPIPDAETYRVEHRKKMLELRDAGFPDLKINVVDSGLQASGGQEFVDHYLKVIVPMEKEIQRLSFLRSWNSIAVDRALFNDDTEKEEWKAAKTKTSQDLNNIVNGDDWKNAIRTWNDLAKKSNLKGDLVDEAAKEWTRIEIGSFDSNMLPVLNRLTELETTIDSAANESPFGNNLETTSAAIDEITQKFHRGEMTIIDAAREIEAQRAQGEQGQSQDIGKKVGVELTEAAKLRTQLAQSKGYKTWAEYKMATQAEPYADQFNSVASRIEFLEGVLKATEPALQKLLDGMAKKSGLTRDQLRESHVALLSPDTSNLGKYFPRENIDALWSKTMLESGFSQADLDDIERDFFPRPNKYTHAYMSELYDKSPKTMTIDSASLQTHFPEGANWNEWVRARIFIVQATLSDSVDGIRTAFHEGGHALHFGQQENPNGDPYAYAAVEIPSMTSEFFLMDKEFLMNEAVARDGARPTAAEIDEYVGDSQVNEFIAFRILVARALFELKLWDVDYTKSTDDFVTTAVRLYGETITRGTGVKGTENHGVDSSGRGPLNAPHFRSAWVEYIGYVLAGVSAYLSAEELLNQFEKETGRRTFYKQPTFAQKMIDGYFRKGILEKFPTQVEKFTGDKFSVDSYAKFLSAGIDAYVGAEQTDCGAPLNRVGQGSSAQVQAQP